MVADSITTPDLRAVPTPRIWLADVLAAILIAGLFIGFAKPGLSVYFTPDDLMNLYHACQPPIHKILLENVLYFSPAYRPMGSLVYRLLYEIGGFHPLRFRAFCFAVILCNLFILYRAAAAISSKEAGILAALFATYNAGFSDLYQSTGTIYDLLCFAFYFLALGMYATIRRRGDYLKPRQTGLLVVLYICALNSKEIAVTLPAVLIAYELVLGRGPRRLIRRWAPAAACALITLPYLAGKFTSSSPLVENEAYRMHVSLGNYLRAFGHYLSLLAYFPDGTLNLAAALLVLILLLTIAALIRLRCLRFLWIFIVISPLPVAFVPLRSAYAMYIPSFGLALFLAVVVIRGRTALARRIGPLPGFARRILCVDTFALCFVVLLAVHGSHPLREPLAEDTLIRTTAMQMTGIHPTPNSKSRILFLDDPFPQENYDLLYILGLQYRIHDPFVHRLKRMSAESSRPEIGSYDYVFTFDGDRLIQVTP